MPDFRGSPWGNVPALGGRVRVGVRRGPSPSGCEKPPARPVLVRSGERGQVARAAIRTPVPTPTSLFGRAGPLIAARLASACLTLAIPLVLARTMPQAEYGTYKLIFLLALTAASILPCGITQSLYFFVPRAKEPRAYFGQTLGFMLVAGALGGLAFWASGPALASALSTPGLLAHRFELAIYCGLLVAASPLETSITSQGRTRAAAVVCLVSDGLRAAALVLPALAGRGLHGMMAAMVGWAAMRLVLVWAFLFASRPGALFSLRLFRKQLAYALPFGMAILLAIPQQYAHQFIVAHAVGPSLFAIYAVGCFELPFVELFYTPTGEVLMVELGELERAGRRGESAAAFRGAVDRLAALILPPLAFFFAVAPAFITAAFGARFAASAPIFRICLLTMPLGVFPLDAALRGRGETRHILASYAVKALVSIPLVWLAVERYGLRGAAVSYVASEMAGRAFLAARLPRALSSPTEGLRLRDLIPDRLFRTCIVSAVLAALGAGALHLCSDLDIAAIHSTLGRRILPLGLASLAFGLGYLVHLFGMGTSAKGPLRVLLSRRRVKPPMPA